MIHVTVLMHGCTGINEKPSRTPLKKAVNKVQETKPQVSALMSMDTKAIEVRSSDPGPSSEQAKQNKNLSNTVSNQSITDLTSRDMSFRQFRKLCADIADEGGYKDKTQIVATFIDKGSSGSKGIL